MLTWLIMTLNHSQWHGYLTPAPMNMDRASGTCWVIQTIRDVWSEFDRAFAGSLLMCEHPPAAEQATIVRIATHRCQHCYFNSRLRHLYADGDIQHSHCVTSGGGVLVLHPHLWLCLYGLQTKPHPSRSTQVLLWWRRLMKRILFVVSVLAVGSIVMVIVLSIYDVIRCSEDQGAGSIALIVLEIPLCVVIWIYSHKSKDIIRHGSAYHSPKMTEYTHKTQHLLNGEDQYKKIKLVQLNLVRFAFAVSFVLHGI